MSTTQSLSAQCEDILASIKEFEKTDQTDRAQRLRLVQSLNKLTHRLKDPKEAIFDHFTNVCQSSSRCFFPFPSIMCKVMLGQAIKTYNYILLSLISSFSLMKWTMDL